MGTKSLLVSSCFCKIIKVRYLNAFRCQPYSKHICMFQMFLSVSVNSCLYGQLLHSLNVIYLAERTILPAIFSSVIRIVSMWCFFVFSGRTRLRNQLNRLYARQCTCNRLAFTFIEALLTAVPKSDNLIISRLMDAGKVLFGEITEKTMRGTWLDMRIKIYLHE